MMKKLPLLLLPLAVLCLAGCRGGASAEAPKISIFCDHIETAARQEGIPIAEIVADLVSSGYTGWLTVEQYGSRHMLEDSAVSIRNVSAALAAQ